MRPIITGDLVEKAGKRAAVSQIRMSGVSRRRLMPSTVLDTLVIYAGSFNKLRTMGMAGCYPIYHFTGRAL